MSECSNSPTEPQPFGVDEEKYGTYYKAHLLEQYKICVDMADKVSSRRSATNNFFLTLHSLLITAIGILSKIGLDTTLFNTSWVIVASLVGFLFCVVWLKTINYYKALNTAKFKVINSIESKLPLSPFKTEWLHCDQKNGTVKYNGLTKVERWIPVILSLLYFALIVFAIVSALYPIIDGSTNSIAS